MKDHHVILGIPQEAGLRAIRKAYRKPARQDHPDPHQRRKAMEERFKEIGEAYEVLRNPKRRAIYDDARKAGNGRADLPHSSPERGIVDIEGIIVNYMDLMRRSGGRRPS